MRALTLHQPWASLIALGVKSIETRSWSTKYRGPLAIHAGANWSALGRPAAGSAPIGDVLAFYGQRAPHKGYKGSVGKKRWLPGNLPLGAVAATCTLVDVVPTDCMDGFDRIVGWETLELRSGDWLPNETEGEYGGLTWDLEANRPYGDFTAGRFAWLLADIVPLDPPVPAKGRQGLWEWSS